MTSKLRRTYPVWFPLFVLVAIGGGVFGAVYFAAGHFASGGAMLLSSVLILRWPHSIWTGGTDVDLGPRARRLGLLGVCLVALFFRFYQLEPPGLWGDDAINGLLALDVLAGKIQSPLQLVNHAFSTFHALTNYSIAGAFAVFGPEPWSLRLPGVVANLLAVPLLYGLAAPIFGARIALIAALFFATSPFQLGHAKGLLQNELGLFAELIALCLIVRGTLGTRPWLLLPAGAAMALSLYTYHAAKLVPLIAAAVLWNAVRLRHRNRPSLRPWILAGAAAFAVCSIPAIIGYTYDPNALFGRIGGLGIWHATGDQSLWPLWGALWRTLTVFHYQQGPQYHWFGVGFDPGFTAVGACLLLHGLVQSVRHCREPQHAMLLGWFLIGLIPGVFSSDAPRGYRILIATPPLYVWAALLPAQLVGQTIDSARVRHALRAVAVALLMAIPTIDFNYYFYRVYSNGPFRWFQADQMVIMARALRAFGPGWTGYVLSDTFDANYETLRFLAHAWNLRLETVASLDDVVPLRREPQAGALFMFTRGPLESSAVVRAFYPEAAVDVRYEPTPRSWWFDEWLPLAKRPESPVPIVGFVAVSRALAADSGGLNATYFSDGGEPMHRVEATPRLDGPRDLPPGASAPTRATWTGALLAPRDGAYRFGLETSGETAVWIDGALAVTQAQPEREQRLAEGLHTLRIHTMLTAEPLLQLRWQPPGEPLAPVPAEVLFRTTTVHGLKAAYRSRDQTIERIERLPYHFFFPERIPGTYSARWHGRLEVPRGGYVLRPESNRPVMVRVDGTPWPPRKPLSAGSHDLEIELSDIAGAPRLRLYWERPGRERSLIPAEAFSPSH